MSQMTEGPDYWPIVEDVREQIRVGNLKPGQKLPSQAKLQQQYEQTEGIVRRALTQLRIEGLVKSHQGKGSFVRDDAAVGQPSAEYTALVQVIDDLQERLEQFEDRLGQLERERDHPAAD